MRRARAVSKRLSREGGGERPAVDQQIMSGDKAGMGGAQKRAGRAEFLGLADPLGRDAGDPLCARRLRGGVVAFGGGLEDRAQPVGFERTRKQEW